MGNNDDLYQAIEQEKQERLVDFLSKVLRTLEDHNEATIAICVTGEQYVAEYVLNLREVRMIYNALCAENESAVSVDSLEDIRETVSGMTEYMTMLKTRLDKEIEQRVKSEPLPLSDDVKKQLAWFFELKYFHDFDAELIRKHAKQYLNEKDSRQRALFGLMHDYEIGRTICHLFYDEQHSFESIANELALKPETVSEMVRMCSYYWFNEYEN